MNNNHPLESNNKNIQKSNAFKPLYKSAAFSFAVLTGLTACNQTPVNTSRESIINAEEVAEVNAEQQADMHVKKRVKENQSKSAYSAPHSVVQASQISKSIQQVDPFYNDLTPPQIESNNEQYLTSLENPVHQVNTTPVSTFSVDVDTGSYSNSRRYLNNGQLPPRNAIREEAFINYFNYDYDTPESINIPFQVHSEVGQAPWNEHRQLLKIGIKGFDIKKADLKDVNLVFLLDVSGSMNAADKLPLLKASLTMLTKQLDENDSVAIVVYAGAAGVVLPATKGDNHGAIINALKQLSAGGSTNGAQGIELAYQIAQENFKKGGVNRVILATDGDFNVGMQSTDKLKALVSQKRKTGIALTTLGFGQGNYNDGLMEQLANIGNGQHAYIDTINEARKVLVDELSSSMQIIAKDVKIQVEFNPLYVAEYRLIGYQNRLLAREDFNNDNVDAAELGAGHTVTALYELTLTDTKNKQIDDLRYQIKNEQAEQIKGSDSEELAFVKIRYKKPESDNSQLMSQSINLPNAMMPMSNDFQFSAAVAGFSQLLKGEKYTGEWHYENCADLASQNKGDDPFGYRAEFVQLVRTAAALQ